MRRRRIESSKLWSNRIWIKGREVSRSRRFLEAKEAKEDEKETEDKWDKTKKTQETQESLFGTAGRTIVRVRTRERRQVPSTRGE
jgi:hypothetical protein